MPPHGEPEAAPTLDVPALEKWYRRRRAGLTASVVLLVLAALVGTWLAWSSGPAPTSDGVVTGPGVGASAPTSLTVTCTADGPVLSSDIVQVGPSGFPVEYRNATGESVGVVIGGGDGSSRASGGGLTPGQSLTRTEATPPGPATIKCVRPESNPRDTTGASITVVDPTELFRPAELDCDGGGQTIVDLAGSAPASSPEEPLTELLSDDALADHDIEGAGYPEVDPRPYVVRQDGRTVAVAGFRVIGPDQASFPDAPSTTSEGPFGYVLVELTACPDALRHR